MNTTTKLSAYGAALALLVAGGWATGTAVGPLVAAPVAVQQDAHSGTVAEHAEPAAGSAAEPTDGTATAASDLPGGLASSANGYTLVPAGAPDGGFSFTVTGPDGAPVTAFDVEHEKRMHLVVVRRDTTGYQHVHPEMAPDGTWTVPLELTGGGSWRAFADFHPTGGAATVLGADLAVPGAFEPVAHAPSRTAQVDGYTVELAGDLVPGRASPVTLTVSRDGAPVTDLQPYLGARGHLVALREGDLAYLHVHPEDGDGPGVRFVAEVPSAGTYRLFLDFRHGDVVRTAEFTVPTAGADAPAPAPHGADGHGH
jgi:hypothetical protein